MKKGIKIAAFGMFMFLAYGIQAQNNTSVQKTAEELGLPVDEVNFSQQGGGQDVVSKTGSEINVTPVENGVPAGGGTAVVSKTDAEIKDLNQGQVKKDMPKKD